MNRLRYTLWRFATDVGSLLSRMVNAWWYGGSTAQTTSSRAHVEATLGDPDWIRRRDFIDWFCFWEEDHCRRWWEEDVERAKYTLKLLQEGLGSE